MAGLLASPFEFTRPSTHTKMAPAAFISPPSSPELTPAVAAPSFSRVQSSSRSLHAMMGVPSHPCSYAPAAAPTQSSSPTLAPINSLIPSLFPRPLPSPPLGYERRAPAAPAPTTPVAGTKRRRTDDDDDSYSDRANPSSPCKRRHMALKTPKPVSVGPPEIPRGLRRSDFLDENTANPATPDWSRSQDYLLVQWFINTATVTEDQWRDCARRLGCNSPDRVSQRWRSLVDKGRVGVRKGTKASALKPRRTSHP